MAIFGRDAYRFIDLLAGCGITVWQTLPVNPTHPDGSPYQCLSAHAGNPLMIDLGWLADRGLLDRAELAPAEEAGIEHRRRCLKLAFESFSTSRDAAFTKSFENFVEQNQGWLADFSLFMALRQSTGGLAWQQWPVRVRTAEPPPSPGRELRLARSIAQLDFEGEFRVLRAVAGLRDYAACPGSDPVRRHPDFCRR